MEDEALVPGSEFYYERLNRAHAIPEAQRSPEVAAWLSSHAALDAALAALPPALPGVLLTEALGGPAALAAVLQVLVHTYATLPEDPAHPRSSLRRLVPELPPLYHVSVERGGLGIKPQPLLRTTLHALAGGAALGLEPVARLLLMAAMSQNPVLEYPLVALDILKALEPSISGAEAEARLAQQLVELQQQLARTGGGSGGGSGSCIALPMVRQLQTVRHVLTLLLFYWAKAVRAASPSAAADLQKLGERAAAGLLALWPDDPRSSLEMGRLLMTTGRWDSPVPLLYALQPSSSQQCYACLTSSRVMIARSMDDVKKAVAHFLRCIQLARQQGSDYYLARQALGPQQAPLELWVRSRRRWDCAFVSHLWEPTDSSTMCLSPLR